jgi:alkanesulfonate monooxygenase SsuD/methylene tetrahydromethanopterin reductase-like flavin-dependent oxidoreductase (luciferase family)
MKFSTQNLLSIREWQTHAEVYRNTLEECRLADELGFDVVWLALDQAAIAGDPEEVADKIRMHHETLGVSHFMGAFARGGLAHDKVVRSMRLFAEKVIPKVA